MKHMRKLLALMIAVVMCMAMTVTVFATPTTDNSITITNTGKTAHTFELYQIVVGDISTDGTTLSNITWGTGVADTFKTDTNLNALKALEGKANDGPEVKAFATNVAAALGTATTSPEVAPADSYEFKNLTSGYYLVKDTAHSQDNAVDGAYTQYIVKVVGKVPASTKIDIPTVEKKVDDKVDSDNTETKITWEDSADYDIGDDVPFQFKGTLPTNYAEYDTYYYEFSDTMGTGLTYNNDAAVYAKIGNDWYDITEGFDVSGAISSIKVDNLKAITTGKKVTFDTVDTEKIASVADTDTEIEITAATEIYVRYTAKLNANCDKTATGNPNEVHLVYSNNPEGDGKGQTKPDKVKVFTFTTEVDKYEPDGASISADEYNALGEEDKANYIEVGNRYQKVKPLTGAGFTIYKKVVDSTVTGAQLGSAIKADLDSSIEASALDANTYYVTKAMTASGATHTLEGLDAGEYVIVETLIPNGYNSYKSKAFTISATHDKLNDDPQLLTLDGGDPFTEADLANATVSGNIINEKGSSLPSTGGIGTTIFYVLGAILVVGAGVVLVTRRRMSA